MPRAVVFLAVVREGSFSAAARALCVSKSVVSEHVKQLEEVCGVRLLERSSRRVRLTEAGQLFVPHAQAMADSWRLGLDVLTASQETPSGHLRISASSFVGHRLVVPVVSGMLKSYPNMSAELQFVDRVVELIEEQIDVAIRVGPLTDSSYIARNIGNDIEMIVASPALAEQVKQCHHPEQLLAHPWVGHSLFPLKRELSGPDGEHIVLPIPLRARSTTSEGLLGLAFSGLGFALMPGLMAHEALKNGSLVRVLPDWKGRTVGLFAMFPSREFVPPKVIVFIEQTKQKFDEIMSFSYSA